MQGEKMYATLTKWIRTLSIGAVLLLVPAAASAVGATYYDAFTAFASPNCSSSGGGSITTGTRTLQWNTPAGGATESRIDYVNDVAIFSPAPYASPTGSGTQAFANFGSSGLGAYPFTYAIELTTKVGGLVVGVSRATIRCAGDGPAVTVFDVGEGIAATYYDGFTAFSAPTCSTASGGSITTGTRTAQWNTPAGGATETRVDLLNDVPNFTPASYASPAGTGTQNFGNFFAGALGSYPFTYTFQFTTSVGGSSVGVTRASISCEADGPGAATFAVGAIPPTATVVEYYWATRDHYFITANPPEIAALDASPPGGWVRTGLTFGAYTTNVNGSSPVCRFYIPPAYGDSHYYTASPSECAAVHSTYPMFVYEAPNVFYINLPGATSGSCPAGSVPVYRLWNNRVDTNHRYTTSTTVRDAMLAHGYVSEGYGPDVVDMCAPE
jgi:Repeat of unknown function (DUF5648)